MPFINGVRKKENCLPNCTMKKPLLPLLALFSLASCIKELQVTPAGTKVPPPSIVIASKGDTIPDKAAFRLKLAQDNNNYDETMIMFNKKADLNYNADTDGAYFEGFGQVNLSCLSKDGHDLSIYTLPYKPGMSVGLNVNAKTDGTYSFSIDYERQIPVGIQVLIKDTFKKDSLDVRGGTYNFTVTKADTNSFGKNRFVLVIRKKGLGQSSNGTPH